ncbi:MAG TPA: T9SS type A sorting domain-containing protein [Brumimicrobium sp.]|nr:T9SS type A sorting domain-containing protein [Brumimicrobium sp.]
MKNLVYLIILTLILLGINSKAFAQSDNIQVNIDGESIGTVVITEVINSDFEFYLGLPPTETFNIPPFNDSISLTISGNTILSYGFGPNIENSSSGGPYEIITITEGDFIDDILIVNIGTYYNNTSLDGLTRFVLVIDHSLSVVENEISVSNALVYPNPVMNNLTVEFETINYDTQIEVYSVNGQLMYVDKDNRSFGFNKVSIDMSDYPTGMYMVRIGNLVKKIVK